MWETRKKKYTNVLVRITRKGKDIQLACDYVLFATGRVPALDFLPSHVRKTFPKGTKNLYFAGDVKNGVLRQTACAVGDGIRTAMEIVNVIRNSRESVKR